MASYKPSTAKLKKDFIFNRLSKYYENIAINQIEWKGLDEISESLTSEIMERWLYEESRSTFFEDKQLGYMNLPFNINGGLNVYYKPTKIVAVGLGYTKNLRVNKDCVIIRDNELEVPRKQLIDYYCEKLADIELTMDIHRNAHKTPYIIETDDRTLLSAKNYYNEIDSNEPVIFKNKNMEGISLEVNNPQLEYINDKFNDEYNSYVAKILTVLGIDNYIEDKAERVQSAEVEANDQYILESFDARVEQRRKACKKINEMFGLTLDIEVKTPTKPQEEVKEDDEDGNIE